MGPKAIDLFAGAGGLSLGLTYSGIDVVGAVEWEEKATTSYKYNIGDHIICEDIKKFGPGKMETFLKKTGAIKSKKEIDIICGGPPCPGFSLIGRSKISNLIKTGEWQGSDFRHSFIDDERNKLFLEFVKYVDFFEPKVFVMENVAGMKSYLSSGNAPIIDIINQEFESLGYKVNVKILNSANYGVPQSRERILFFGTRMKKKFSHPKGFEWANNIQDAFSDLPEVNPIDGKPKSTELKLMKDIKGKRRKKFINWSRLQSVPIKRKRQHRDCTLHNTRKVNPRDQAIFPLLTSGQFSERILYKHVFPDLLKEVKRLLPKEFKMLPKSKEYLIVAKDPEDTRKWKWYDPSKFGDKMRRMRLDSPGPTVVAHLAKDGYMFVHPTENRTITVREASRIQSFPDSFDFSAGGKVAFSHQMRQVGNAVPPLLGLAIGQTIMTYLGLEISLSLEEVFGLKNPSLTV